MGTKKVAGNAAILTAVGRALRASRTPYGTSTTTLKNRIAAFSAGAVATSCDPPSAPPGWRRSQLSPSYPFAEEWVLKKVFAVEFVDYLVGYEALECLGDTADIPYPVGLHELAGKHLGMVGLGNPL